MKTIILALMVSLAPNISHSSESIICAYNKHDSKYSLKAHLVDEKEWDNGLVIMDHDIYLRVYRLGHEGNIKRVISTVYLMEEGDFEILPTKKQIKKAEKDIQSLYKGANLINDVEIEVPGLVLVQQIPGKIVKNKYIDNHFEVTLRTIVVTVENRDNRKLEEYCPGKKVEEGFLPPLK